MNKNITLILILFFQVLGVFSQVTAEQPPGEGTSDNPYEVSTFNHLFWISDAAATPEENSTRRNANYIQTANINASASSSLGGGFRPIGTSSIGTSSEGGFTGVYDGQNFTIDSLFILRTAESTGMFGNVLGEVKNVRIENASITGGSQLGVIAGRVSSLGIISNCHVVNSIVFSATDIPRTNIGGLVGRNNNAIILDSSVENSVITSTNANNTGGLVGLLDNVGGSNGRIERSYVNAIAIEGDAIVGGFVGKITNANNLVRNSYARGTISGNSIVAGFVGEFTAGTIEDSYSTVSATSTSDTPSGFGNGTGGTVTASFWDEELTGLSTSDYGSGEDTATMNDQSFYISEGWDFVCETTNGTNFIWNLTLGINDDYPNLDSDQIIPEAIQPDGEGTVEEPYLIASLENLLWISLNASSWDAFFEQIADIDASPTEFWGCEGIDGGWIVIASDSSETFSGNYNGGGFTIENLFINSNQTNVGLFGNLSGEVFNLNLNNFSITASSTIGALAGTVETGASVHSIYVNEATITSTATGVANVGGVVGLLEGGLIRTSLSSAAINGDENVGGFVGLVTGGEVNNSYVRGNVNGVTNVGGFAGSITGGLLDKSYAANEVAATGEDEDAVGFANQTGTDLVTNSFYDSDITALDNSDATGETTINLNFVATFLAADWDFVCEAGSEDIWRIVPTENDAYPIFNTNFDLPDLTPEGEGTSENPYLIANLGNLIWLANNEAEWDKFYLQTADIDLSESIDFECEGDNVFQMIAQGELEAFSGNYNGQDFTLSNLTLNFNEERIAFFGTLDNATISNLNFTNASVTGNSNIGILAGIISNNSMVESISIDGVVTQNNEPGFENIGGLAGSISNSSISDVSIGTTTFTLTSFGEFAGGLGGRISASSITNITLSGSINSLENYTGGLAGEASATSISSVSSSIEVLGVSFVGGIVGEANSSANISDVLATGNITINSASTKIGGLVGYLVSSSLSTSSNFTGSIDAADSNEVGGAVGHIENSTLATIILTPDQITGNNQVGGLVGFALTSNLEEVSVQFNLIQATDQVGGISGLFEQSSVVNASVELNIAEDNLIMANNQVGGVFGRVQGDGSGNGVSISDITNQVAIEADELVGGLIGDIEANVLIEGIVLDQIVIEASTQVGGLIGRTSAEVTLQQVGINGLSIFGDSGLQVGGLVGVSSGSIFSSYVKNFNINFTTALQTAGGFVGLVNAGLIEDCYVLSPTTSSFSELSIVNVGGFVGEIDVLGTGIINKAYAAVNMPLVISGFAGVLNVNDITNSFWDIDLIDGTVLTPDTSATATFSSDMNLEATFTAAGWDFECEVENGTLFTWGINTTDNQSYAFLRWEGFESECIFDTNWIGVISSDWAEPSNWADNIVPSPDTDISIPASAPNYPLLDQDRTIRSLFIENGATISIGENNTLTLNGTIVGQGTIVGGMESSLLVGGQGEVNLRMNQDAPELSNMLFNLSVIGGDESRRILTLTNSVFVNNVLDLPVGTTTLRSNQNLTLYCDFNSSNLKVAQVNNQAGLIEGGLVAEQCFPARRAFRFVSPSLSMSGSIHANWQEGASAHNDASVPTGYGTHITGNGFQSSSPTLNIDNNGFDWNPSGNPSMFFYSSGTQSWSAATTTNTSLSPNASVRLMVRGDSEINITQNATPPRDTKLRTRGTPNPSTSITNTFDNNYAQGDLILTGNPYWSQVDVAEVISASSNLENYFYYWDPSLGGTPTVGEPGGRGAWVAYLTGPFGEDPNQSPAGTIFEYDLNGEASLSSSQVSNILQPMQAVMFVASGGSVSLNYNQSNKKIEENQVQVFSNSNRKYINLELYKANDSSTPLDGLRIIFQDGANNGLGAGDIRKLGNLDENFARIFGNQLLAVELRDLPTSDDLLPLFLNAHKHQNYRMSINASDFEGVNALLKDNYTGTETPLVEGNNDYTFQVDPAISASVAFNRFLIEFKESTFSVAEFSKLNSLLYPNPVKDSFTLELPTNFEDYSLELYDLLGRKLTNKTYSSSTHENKIVVSNFNFPSGIYFIKVIQEGKELLTHKFVKE